MKIYTRGGDNGTTGLYGGQRVGKDHPRILAVGAVDELNAAIGVARAGLAAAAWDAAPLDRVLAAVQHQLFCVGAEVATPAPVDLSSELPAGSIDNTDVLGLEHAIDGMDGLLPPLRQFILPGGCAPAAQLHLARCVCRRAEATLVAASRETPVRDQLLSYLNRVSDLLFVAARWANHAAGLDDIPWKKGAGVPGGPFT